MKTVPKFYVYNAPTSVCCVVYAASDIKASKLLCTTPVTVKARSEIYTDLSKAPAKHRAGLKLALASPGSIFILKEGKWVPIDGPAEELLLSAKQLRERGQRNALVGDKPMSTHTIRTDDETWRQFLELGGSTYFRTQIPKDHAAMTEKKEISRKAAIAQSKVAPEQA